MRLIEELKRENRLLTEELAQANQTIQFLGQLTGSNPKTVQQNLKNVQMPNMIQPGEETTGENDGGKRQGSNSSAKTERRGVTDSQERRQIITERIIKDKDNIEKFFREKSETLQNIASGGGAGGKSNPLPSAVNETKDAITERIIHTVNMMKEVLQSNLTLRETI